MKKFKRSIVAFALMIGMLLSLNQTTVYAKTNTCDKPIVIVLDPGHGGHDGGAVRYWGGRWYREKTLNLAIAKACKEELEKFSGVKVYLTRSNDSFVSLGGRVWFAKERDADLFVALHNNSSISSRMNGVSVYYPNMSYRSRVGKDGKDAAFCIQKELVALGIKNNGTHYRNTENGSKYPNKSKSDYYSVIRQSKMWGFPGLIVEHAFVSNSSDCAKFFSSSDKLKKLGRADAKGIAQYYGLVEKDTPTLTSAENDADGNVHLQWDIMDGMDGYRIYRRAQGTFSYKKVTTLNGKEVTDYVDASTKKGTTYYYTIAGYHKGRKKTIYTDMSNVIKVAAFETLYTPQNLKVSNEQGVVQIAWEATEHTDGYIIERKTANDTDYQVLTQISGAGVTSYIQEADAVSADYRICSYRKYGQKIYQSEFSETVSYQQQ